MSMIVFGFIALLALAVLFVLWPMLAAKWKKNPPQERNGSGANALDQTALDREEAAQRRAANRKLFEERVAELDVELANHSIDAAQHARLKAELAELLEQDSSALTASSPRVSSRYSKAAVFGTALAIPLLAVLWYWQWGAKSDWDIYQLNIEKVKLQDRSGSPERIAELNETLQEKLEARVKEEPSNLQNWFLLARTAFDLRDYGRSISAYRYILEQEPNAAQVWNELAQVSYVAAGNRFTPDVKSIFDRALSLNPHDSSLLGLAGLGAYESGQFQTAIDYWQQAANGMAAEDPRRATWDNAISRARQAMGQNAPAESAVASSSEEGAQKADGLALEVNVALAEGVEVGPNDTVFVYARAWQGPRMPLAIQRLNVSQLPTTVTLTEAMAMQAGMTIASFEQLELVARVSATGNAQAQPGDWQASAGPVPAKSQDKPIDLTISSRLP